MSERSKSLPDAGSDDQGIVEEPVDQGPHDAEQQEELDDVSSGWGHVDRSTEPSDRAAAELLRRRHSTEG